MDINEGLFGGAKYLWEIFVMALSSIFSWLLYKAKKNGERLDMFEDTLDEHHTMLSVFEERMSNISSDIVEIKEDLKKILFKL